MELNEKFAALWERLIIRNEIDVCAERLNGANLLDVNILRVVQQHPGILVKDIIVCLKLNNSTASSAIKRLESKGLIKRQISQDDLRSYRIDLTEEGKQAMLEQFEREKELMSYFLQAFNTPEEQATFVKLFEQIVDFVNSK